MMPLQLHVHIRLVYPADESMLAWDNGTASGAHSLPRDKNLEVPLHKYDSYHLQKKLDTSMQM